MISKSTVQATIPTSYFVKKMHKKYFICQGLFYFCHGIYKGMKHNFYVDTVLRFSVQVLLEKYLLITHYTNLD